MRWSSFGFFAACLVVWESSCRVDAFTTNVPTTTSSLSRYRQSIQKNQHQATKSIQQLLPSSLLRKDFTFRLSSSSSSSSSSTAEDIPASEESSSDLSEDEWKTIASLVEKASSDEGGPTLDQVVLEALPTLNPSLIMKLRGAIHDSRTEFVAVADALNEILDSQLTSARDLLKELLEAGEIRKLDAIIGKSAREGKLDVAFFQVLNMNLQEAAAVQAQQQQQEEPESSSGGDDDETTMPQKANRFQILQHVYTRCQEEVEKTIPPGVALLNKLLRTEVSSIRSNQLNHYLCPQPNIIKSPDGKEIQLDGGGKILVSHQDFIDAVGNAVKQIRTVEKAGGANREMAANMVEACRTVAKEARIVIGEHFGRESKELINYEEGLQPVFRPESAESPYMQGER